MQMKTFALGTLGMTAALALGAAGCELIAAVDHDLIPQGGSAPGGGGGAGGGTTTATTTTGGGMGGMGGSGGGGCVAANCPDPGSDCLEKACDGDMCGTPTPSALNTACNSAPGEGGGTMAGFCDGDGACVECNDSTQCVSPEVCDTTAHECVPMQCQNGVQDPGETGLDCGGPVCGKCPNTQGCMNAGDCLSGYCNAMVCTACTGTGAGQCAGTEYCNNGVCVTKEANGTSCTDPAQCSTGNCTTTSQGQLCCDLACTGGCQSCAMADTGSPNGTCDDVTAGQDPKNFCPAAACDATACNGNGACNDVAAGTNCGSGPMCAGSSLNPQDTCDAGGVCQGGMAAACPNGFVCESATACFTMCTAHANCVTATHYCGGVGGAGGTANQCNPKLAMGTTCDVDEECLNGTCNGAPGGTCN